MSDYGSDYEHGWNEWPFHGQNIMTCVRDQGGKPTCIFHALCAAYEIDFRRLLALEKESMSTDFLFNIKEFIREFEETYGALGTDEDGMRLQNAILLFQQRGVLASANVWKEDKRVQLVGSQEHPNISFAAMEDILEEGKPVIGGFTICDDDRFRTLGRNEVYTSNADLNAACGTYDHLVVFIGSGSEAKKPFLVFLNSEGVQFGKNGYGKVLFTQARAFRTLDLESVLQQQSPPPVLPPPPPSPSRKRSLDASNSSSSSPVGSMIWKSDPRKKRYRSSCSNPGGSDVLTDSNEFLSVSLEGETKEMDTVKTDRIDKDEDGSCSSSDDDMTEDRSSSEEEKSNDEMNGSDDEDEETPKKLVVCKRVAETALKESVSHKKAKSLASDKEAKIAAPSGCKTGDKKGVETHSTKKVKQLVQVELLQQDIWH